MLGMDSITSATRTNNLNKADQIDPKRASQDNKSVVESETPTHITADEIIVGAGPFGAGYLEQTAKLEEEFGDTLSACRGNQDHGKRKIVVIDKTPSQDWGRGSPWLTKEHGSMNSGAEIGYGEPLTQHMARNYQTYADQTNTQSAPVRALMNAAVLRGNDEAPDTTQAFSSRAQAAQEAADRFAAVVEKLEASDNIDLVRIPEATVTKIELNAAGDQKARVTIATSSEAGREIDAQATDVFLATGTNEVKSVSQGVSEHAFIQAMNTEDLRAFLSAKGCIDEDGLIKEGTKLLLGGLGLSNRDALTVVSNLMGIKSTGPDGSERVDLLFKENPNSPFGYEVNEAVAEKYQGAITIISARGTPLQPRFAHSPDCADIPKVWENGKSPLLNPSMQHALRLHNDGREAICGTWNDLVKGCVAAAHDTLPSKVGADMDKEPLALLSEQHDACETHLSAVKKRAEAENRLRDAVSISDKKQAETEIEEAKNVMNSHLNATYRKLAFSTALGFGGAANLTSGDKTRQRGEAESSSSSQKSEVDRLVERAPYTYAGRTGYPYLGAVMRSATDLDNVAQYGSNKEFTDVWAANFLHVTASPPIIHSIAGKMSEAGVISAFRKNRYEAIQVQTQPEDGRALMLETKGETENFDALVVSPAVRGLDPLEVQLLAQSENPAERYANEPFGQSLRDKSGTLIGLPSFTKNLQVIDKSGQASGVHPYGGIGKGIATPRTSNEASGSLIASTRWDVNNRESAYDFSARLAQFQQMKHALGAAGKENPEQVLTQILDQIENPTKDEPGKVQSEINSFSMDYLQAKALQVFVKKAEEHAQQTVGAQTEAATLRELGTDKESATEAQKKEAKEAGEKAAGREFSRLYLQGQTALGRITFYDDNNIDVTQTDFEPFTPVKADKYFASYANYTVEALAKARDKVIEEISK